MIKTNCETCNRVLFRSPSKIHGRNYCSLKCYSRTRNKELTKHGIKTRITAKSSKNLESKRIAALKEKTTGDKHYAWEGESVGYRGLHYWLHRKLGKPRVCSKCKKESDKPRVIQWANIDGKYRRILGDYIALCASCHKLYDLKLKSTQGGLSANQ